MKPPDARINAVALPVAGGAGNAGSRLIDLRRTRISDAVPAGQKTVGGSNTGTGRTTEGHRNGRIQRHAIDRNHADVAHTAGGAGGRERAAPVLSVASVNRIVCPIPIVAPPTGLAPSVGVLIVRDGEVVGAIATAAPRPRTRTRALAVLGRAGGVAMASATVTREPAWPRRPARPSCCPAAPTPSSTCSVTRGSRWSAVEWRYADARVAGDRLRRGRGARRPAGPGTVPNRTYDVVPHAEAADYDDSDWRTLSPARRAAARRRPRVLQLVSDRP